MEERFPGISRLDTVNRARLFSSRPRRRRENNRTDNAKGERLAIHQKKNSKRGEGEKMSVPNTPRVAPRSDDFLELTGPPPPSIVGFSMRKIYPRMIDPRPSPPALSFTLYRLTLWPTDIELLLHLRPSRLSPSLRIPSRAL